jgi:hypothetical protein
MRDRSRTAHPPVMSAAAHSQRRGGVTRIRSGFWSVIGWLRGGGYPEEAPPTGYSPLLALNGPIALTPRQIDNIVADLDGGGVAGVTDIEVAITKATDRLPTESQLRTAIRLLGKNPEVS